MSNSWLPDTDNNGNILAAIAWRIVADSAPKEFDKVTLREKKLRNYYTNEFIKVYNALINSTPLADEE